MSYREDLKPNKYLLDEEWENHQDLYMDYAEAYSEAVLLRDNAKEELNFYKSKAQSKIDKIKAELDIQIRTSYESLGFSKITEAVVASWIIRQDIYQDALDEYREIIREYSKKLNQAEYHVNICDNVRKTFEHKKTAMDNLTRLMIGGYYSSKPARDVHSVVKNSRDEKRETKTSEILKESFRRRGKAKYGEKS